MATINGTVGNDRLFADNTLLDQDFYHIFDGKEGNDILYGGRGINTLTGGTGSNTFIIGRVLGGTGTTDNTTITDFDPSKDFISLIGLNYSDVTVSAQGSDALIKDNLTGQTLATLKNVNAATLVSGLFVNTSTLNLTPTETNLLAPSTDKLPDVLSNGVRIVELTDYDKRPAYYLSSALYTTITSDRDTSNKFVAFDFTDPPAPYGTYLGGRVGPLQHAHSNEFEAFFVVSGTYIFTEGEQIGVNSGELIDVEVKAGTLAFGPLGRVHGFRTKPEDGPGRIFSLALPAGLDQFFVNAGTRATNRYNPIVENSVQEAVNTAFWAGQRGDDLFLQLYDIFSPPLDQLRPPSSDPAIDGRPIPTFNPLWPDHVTTSIDATDRPITTGVFGEERLSLVSSEEVKGVTGRVAWKGPFSAPTDQGGTMNYDSITLAPGTNSDFLKTDTIAPSQTDQNNPDPFTRYQVIYTLEGSLSIKFGSDESLVLDPLTYIEIPTGATYSLANLGTTDVRALSIEIYNAPTPTPATLSTLTAQSQLVINGDPITTSIKFQLTGKNVAEGIVNEIGVFATDENGMVDGIAPGEAGYTTAALKASKVITSAISENFSAISGSTTVQSFESNNLAFVLVQNGTIQDVINNKGYNSGSPAKVFFGSPNAAAAGQNSLQIQDLGSGKFQLDFEDYLGTKDFSDISLTAEIDNASPSLGTFNWRLQEQRLGLLDLTYNTTGSTLAGSLVDIEVANVNKKADYSHAFGFYKVENEAGDIRDPLTGQVITATAANRQSYLQAAIALSQEITDGFNVFDQDPTAQGFSTKLSGGSLYAPFLVTNGSIADYLSKNPTNSISATLPNAFVPFVDINPDGLIHSRILGNNTWGFEDLVGGGDTDFNDLVVKLNVNVA